MCMCANLLQLCLTFCDPMDHSPSGSSVHGTPNPVESREVFPNSTVSLTSQRHPENLPEVTGTSRGNPGILAWRILQPNRNDSLDHLILCVWVTDFLRTLEKRLGKWTQAVRIRKCGTTSHFPESPSASPCLIGCIAHLCNLLHSHVNIRQLPAQMREECAMYVWLQIYQHYNK